MKQLEIINGELFHKKIAGFLGCEGCTFKYSDWCLYPDVYEGCWDGRYIFKRASVKVNGVKYRLKVSAASQLCKGCEFTSDSCREVNAASEKRYGRSCSTKLPYFIYEKV